MSIILNIIFLYFLTVFTFVYLFYFIFLLIYVSYFTRKFIILFYVVLCNIFSTFFSLFVLQYLHKVRGNTIKKYYNYLYKSNYSIKSLYHSFIFLYNSNVVNTINIPSKTPIESNITSVICPDLPGTNN